MIYLDYNSTTPVAPEAVAAMRPYYEEIFGNPSCIHTLGIEARKATEDARAEVAGLIGATPEEIVFTSGGTESNNHALKGIAEARRGHGNRILTSSVEHPSVLEVCRRLQKNGFFVTFLPVDSAGRVNPSDVAAAITPRTILISIMHANHETGTLQPISEISRIARKRGIAFHTDAAQTAGKIPVHVDVLGVDLLSLTAHKMYGPKGVGALYVRRNTLLSPLLDGAGHENGRRAGTENVPAIAGFGRACAIAARRMPHDTNHAEAMRSHFIAAITSRIANATINGHPDTRVAGTVSVSIPGINAEKLITILSGSLALSAGAACHSMAGPSHVLRAMGMSEEIARSTFRASFGRLTTADEINAAASLIAEAIKNRP